MHVFAIEFGLKVPIGPLLDEDLLPPHFGAAILILENPRFG
jgi:hypothetical protein